MQVISTINELSFDVEFAVDPSHEGSFIAKLDGREVRLQIIERKPRSLTLSIDGQVGFYEFSYENGRITEVVYDCRAYRTKVSNPQYDQLEKLLEEFGAGLGGTATATVVAAPMPGKILGISVHPGDKLTLGQVVLVLEAMKMENEISSTVEGQVSQIHVKVGDVVNLGDPLVEIEPPG